ncbi:hypothetical protein ACJ41O_014085 [Fusarium nematophilum]
MPGNTSNHAISDPVAVEAAQILIAMRGGTGGKTSTCEYRRCLERTVGNAAYCPRCMVKINAAINKRGVID